MSISGATLASCRTKRGIGTAAKDRRADAVTRLSLVRAKYGDDAVDTIERTWDGFRATVGQVSGPDLVGLAKRVHGHGRLRKVADGMWVVTL